MSDYKEFCSWTYSPQTPDGDETWSTNCGELHTFIDGTPEDNSYQFCPYCGDEVFQSEGEA